MKNMLESLALDLVCHREGTAIIELRERFDDRLLSDVLDTLGGDSYTFPGPNKLVAYLASKMPPADFSKAFRFWDGATVTLPGPRTMTRAKQEAELYSLSIKDMSAADRKRFSILANALHLRQDAARERAAAVGEELKAYKAWRAELDAFETGRRKRTE
jgi:hypothetical protein